MKQDDLALCPVTTYVVAPIQAYGAVLMRLDFLSHPMQDPKEAHQGRNYLLTVAEARKLAQRTLAVCAELESGETPTGPGPKH